MMCVVCCLSSQVGVRQLESAALDPRCPAISHLPVAGASSLVLRMERGTGKVCAKCLFPTLVVSPRALALQGTSQA